MKAAAVIAIAIASAAGGAAVAGWIVSNPQGQQLANMAPTRAGYMNPDEVPVGPPPGNISWTGLDMKNPLGNSKDALQTGKQLFTAMNCAGCHGYGGVGGMGPNLTDTYWRYGGAPSQIYSSISQGRPKGMPAWGIALPPREIWALTAYVTSLGGSPALDEAGESRGTNSSGPNPPKPSQSGAGLEGQ